MILVSTEVRRAVNLGRERDALLKQPRFARAKAGQVPANFIAFIVLAVPHSWMTRFKL